MNPDAHRPFIWRHHRLIPRQRFSVLLGACALFILGACAEERQEEREAAFEEYIPVAGYLPFGSQCPYGSISSPDEIPAALWSCPMELEQLQIREAPRPLYLQADCRKKLVSLRTQDGSSDISWQTMPDGSFSITLEDQEMVFESDGTEANGPCRVKARVEVMGVLNCTDRDRVDIPFESVWWLNPEPLADAEPSPAPVPAPNSSSLPEPPESPPGYPFFPWREDMPNARPAAVQPELRECRFKESCYLHAPHVLKQCD